ncbi:MAG: zinc carboxypeptidase [Bacteroidetes bacterium]|nr:zinc carboxypeptidase [Bacteroidota bacterium]
MKKLLFFLFLLGAQFYTKAQLQSPDEFLGYRLGSRFTPHHQIVNYFKQVALAAPAMVKLQYYGETNEHRPLWLAFISSAENMANLESIRQNNLQLAGATSGTTEKPIPIVWLSYNVHGNEASSSEASMLTLYELVNPKNTQTRQWLSNTVVVIDPCLNPDGRDRYVNWFNSVVGKQFNPNVIAREHNEPWPGGRTNHYNFDLNRDWAWQTQQESRQRIKQYLNWMPQVHVDFHEQGINDNYYFAPAAQPYHEAITAWQRKFQEQIGKNHARYFDKNGWLYFTKEIFDLLYPSYGDTYPIYNGSIGMTYEQAGGPEGGLGVLTHDGDTLTLYDRLLHHYTTSLSTIEVASQNAAQLVSEFKNYFIQAKNGTVGFYKTYIIKNPPSDHQKVKALLQLLDQNKILYGTGNGSGKGFNYQTKKEEGFTIAPNDIVISAAQPAAVMVKALFEPNTKLTDSVTYDITAWAMPYAYGLQAYASTLKFNVTGTYKEPFEKNQISNTYACVMKWEGKYSAMALAQLLARGFKLRMADAPFETGNEKFNSGSIIIFPGVHEKPGDDFWNKVSQICNTYEVNLYPIASGMVDKGYDMGSSHVIPLKAPRVALLTGNSVSSNAAGEVWHFFEQELNYPVTLINAEDIKRIDHNIDVLVLPNGYYEFLMEKDDAKILEQWIKNGGKLVAIESAVSQLAKQDWSALKIKTDTNESNSPKDLYASLQKYNLRERDAVSGFTPGAIFNVELDNSNPLAFGYPGNYYTLKMDSKVYEFIKEEGWNVGVLKKDNQLAGYVGSKLSPLLKDGLLFGTQRLGKGTVVYLADNILFRNFWENGKLMFCNAVFLVGQ